MFCFKNESDKFLITFAIQLSYLFKINISDHLQDTEIMSHIACSVGQNTLNKYRVIREPKTI